MRIVCLSAEAADICHRLGAWEQVVAVSAFARVPGLPKPVVSGFSSGNLSRVLSMAPDLVITFSDVQAQLAGDLIRMGCQVLALNCHSIEGVVRSIHLLGGVLGRADAAGHLAQWFSGELARLQFRPARRPRVYFEEWDDPPIAGIGWVQEVVRLAGGDPLPLGAGFKAEDRICSTEDVLRHDPEVILLSWCGKPANIAAVKTRPGWADCAAVRDGWICSVDPDKILQAGPALVEGLVAIRKVLATWCANHREPRHPPQVHQFSLLMSEKYSLPEKKGKNGLGAGVWNIGVGTDPFGGPTRDPIPMLDRLAVLADAGMTYFEAHDSEIPAELIEEARQRADKVGIRCGMYTPSFFASPVFKDGAMTSNDPKIRALAVENGKRAIDGAVGLGAEVVVFWNGREGFDFVLTKNGREAFKRLVEGFNQVAQYAKEKYGDQIRLAVEPKPNEPRANMYLATVGEVLYMISRLDEGHRHLFGVNPETAHSRIAGLDYLWDVEMCLEGNKLFYIHLNSQDAQRYDQDLPFGYIEPVKDLALLVTLQDANYEGIIAFDIKAPRTDEPKDITDIITVSSKNLVWLWEKARSVDRNVIAQFREEKRNTALAGYLTSVLYGR